MQNFYRQYFRAFWGVFLFGTLAVFVTVEAIDPRGENDWPFTLGHNYSGSVLNAARQLETLSERPSVLVFGTSRSVYLSPAVLGSEVLNLHVIYGTPMAVLDFLGRLDKRHLANTLRIYYQLDYFTFSGDSPFLSIDYESFWRRLFYKFRNFNLSSILAAWHKVVYNLNDVPKQYVHADGYIIPVAEKTFDGNLRGTLPAQALDVGSVSLLGEIDRFAKRHDIEITYFIPPFPAASLKRMKFSQKKLFVESILRQIDGYFDWSYLPQASPFNEQFADYFHPKFDLMKRLFTEVATPEYFITADNAARFLEGIRPYYANR